MMGPIVLSVHQPGRLQVVQLHSPCGRYFLGPAGRIPIDFLGAIRRFADSRPAREIRPLTRKAGHGLPLVKE